jgi:hypothetical protein
VTRVRLTRIFWIGAAAILVAAALVAIAALLRGSLGDTDWKILVTLLALLVAGGTAVSGLALLEHGVLARAGWVVAGTATVAFVIVAVATWEGYDNETLARWAGTAAVVVPALLVVSTQRLLLRDSRLLFLVYGSALALGLAVLITSIGIWTDDFDDAGWKAAAALWILGVLGWLLVPVLQRLAGTTVAPPADIVEHVIANLDGVELVVNAEPSAGSLVIESAGGELVLRNPAGAIQLRPGERLVLRRHATG